MGEEEGFFLFVRSENLKLGIGGGGVFWKFFGERGGERC